MRQIHYQKSGIKMASQRLRIGRELDLGEETEYCPCWRQTSKEEGQFDHHQDQHQHHQCLSLYLMGKMHSEKLFGCLFCRSYGRTSGCVSSRAPRRWRPPNYVIPAPLPLVALVLSPPHPGYGLRGDLIFRVGHPWVGARELQVALRMICKDTNAIL